MKLSAKRGKQESPYASTSPLPIPSLNERILTSYASSPGPSRSSSDSSSSRTTLDRKVNPSHFTRAHLIPTPYIGPPKRKYTQRSSKVLDQPMNADTDREASEGPSSSQLSSISQVKTNDIGSFKQDTLGSETDSTSTQPNQTIVNQSSNLAETAIMLAALSSLSSNNTSSGNLPNTQTDLADPSFISFLKVYLATLESQQQNSPKVLEPSTASTSETLSENAQTPTITSIPHLGSSKKPEDKENWKPPPPVQSGKENSKGKEKEQNVPQSLPLGSSRVNTWNSSASLAGPGKGMIGSSDASSSRASTPMSSDSSRKRKLSNAAQSDQNLQDRKRTLSASKQNFPQDLSGIRVNTGWGGLRVRSDGTLVGEHRPTVMAIQQTAPVPIQQQQPLFRSTANLSTAAPIRKGPYVVPEWAKGVPAPAPPKLNESEQKEKDMTKTKKKGKAKSKPLARLGGKSVVKQANSMPASAAASNTPPKAVDTSKSDKQKETTGLAGPRTPPKKSSPIRLPFLAQTSPAAKSSFAAFFQAFQTSPIRSGSTQKEAPFTPRRTSATSPHSAKFTSLFTPSPAPASVGPKSKGEELFPDDDLPPSPSPSPSKRGTRPFLVNKCLTDRLLAAQEHPESDLPVASSDDNTGVTKLVPEKMISSDSTVMNSSKIHDWSSLDLPPSSPPPPSSPTLAPIEGSDLPCSDSLPLTSDEDSPPIITDNSSTHTSPDTNGDVESPESAHETETDVENVADFNLIDDTNFTTFGDNPFADLNLEQGSAAEAAFDTLQNLGGEVDLTEAWNLLNDVATNEAFAGLDADQWQSWINDSSFGSLENGCGLPNNETQITSIDDILTSTATQFSDLFKGSLI